MLVAVVVTVLALQLCAILAIVMAIFRRLQQMAEKIGLQQAA